jgi:DNA/RNA-binding domain of Phe-tRNA-synthetase-like protein
MQIQTSTRIQQQYPDACFGFLAIENFSAPLVSPELEAEKVLLQARLRESFPDQAAIRADPVIQAYATYYRRFKKSYHVALQLETVAVKGIPVPSVVPLVECMFMGELVDRTLTAVHDLDKIQGDVMVDVADGDEMYTLLRGVEQRLKPADMFMRDEAGIISSIIYGPDARTQVTSVTGRALFTVYAPPGIGPERVQTHLAHLRDYVLLVCPQSRVVLEQVG